MNHFRLYHCLIALSIIWTQIAQANPLSTPAGQTKQASLNQDVRSFFETGRLRSEDRLRFQKPPDDAIPVQESSKSWQFIIFRAGGFSFWMPPGVLSEEKIVLDTALGELNFRTLASNTDDRRYVVGYAASLTEEQKKSPTVLFSAIQDKITPDREFKFVDQRPLDLDKYPGREFQFEDGDETIIIRTYLVEGQIYAVGVRYPTDKPQTRETRAFLNALQLL